MRWIASLSAVAAFAPIALAQHGVAAGGAHVGGFSSAHSFSMHAPSGPSSFSTSVPYRPNTFARPNYSGITGPPPSGAAGPPPGSSNGRWGYRPPYNYGAHRPYYYSNGVYLVPSWLGYGYYGGPYDYGDSGDSGAVQPNATAGSEYPPGNTTAEADYPPAPPAARPAYQPEAGPQTPPDQPAVTLIFKDGRAPEQVQNYALTPTTLYVLDGVRRREIALDDLDLPLTEKTNREAGVDFVVPAGD